MIFGELPPRSSDEWWHGIKVLSIEEKPKGKRFPKIVSAIGKSPPQYPDLDDEDETED